MEYIILQPLQTRSDTLNVSIIERKIDITADEKKLIMHEAGGPYSGFIVKKILPLNYQPSVYTSEKGDSSFKLNVFMRHATNPEMQQVKTKKHLISCIIVFNLPKKYSGIFFIHLKLHAYIQKRINTFSLYRHAVFIY